MASFNYVMTSLPLVILGLAYGTQGTSEHLQTLYNGIRAQEKLLLTGHYNEILPNGGKKNKSIIPVEEVLGCLQCGGDAKCTERCTTFYHLLHSITLLHDEYQKLMVVRDQNTDDQEIGVLSVTMDKLTTQACSLLTSKLGAENFDCTYTELMKTKATLDLLFLTKEIGDSILTYAQKYNTRLVLDPEEWTDELKCKISDPDTLLVVNNVFSSTPTCA